MYLIKKVEFDSMENEIDKAICVTNVGVIDGTESDAQKWIDDHESTLGEKYTGWDGERYPYYKGTDR